MSHIHQRLDPLRIEYSQEHPSVCSNQKERESSKKNRNLIFGRDFFFLVMALKQMHTLTFLIEN